MKSVRWLFLIFVLLPLLEIYVMVKVGGVIGAWPTVGLVLVAAIVGATLIRVQGYLAWRRVTETLVRGQLPAMELLEGVVFFISGLLLIVPGFFTDAIALLCLIPPARRALLQWILRRSIIANIRTGTGTPSGVEVPRTIEGDFRREDDRHR